jgi:ubiquinone/menaquinone biosynthesis C-methylase UbiE
MSTMPGLLANTLKDDARPRLADEGIWSVLPEDAEGADWDSLATTYDRVASARLYTRLVWDADPADFTAYAREAMGATDHGGLLDVACGSLTFTDVVYAHSPRPAVLADRSITMLQMGRERLANRRGWNEGKHPQPTLLQADGLDLPFRDGTFATVACYGSLHVFEDPGSAVAELYRCLAPGGRLFLTGLVDTGRWIGLRWMRMLKRFSHLATIQTADEFIDMVAAITGARPVTDVRGNLVYVTSRPKPATRRTS